MKNVFKITVLLLFSSIGLHTAQAQKCSFSNVINAITELTPYQKYNSPMDMTKVLNNKVDNFLGYIGVNRKRLRIYFTSITKSKTADNTYEVEGYSTVMKKNKRTFKGTFTLLSHYRFTEVPHGKEEGITYDEGEVQGFSTFTYRLVEDEKLSATGVFEGKMAVLWFRKNNQQPENSPIYTKTDGPDGPDYQFLGTWTSYKTKKPSVASWGDVRIPCSGDFDIGEGDFVPNEKYRKYGWDED